METKIIIPNKDNDGSDNAVVLDGAIRVVCKRFGGATVCQAKGYWLNQTDRLSVGGDAEIIE